MPGKVFRTKRDIAIRAPVLPAEMAAAALPSLTAAIVCHMPLLPRPRRKAWLGLSSMATETSL